MLHAPFEKTIADVSPLYYHQLNTNGLFSDASEKGILALPTKPGQSPTLATVTLLALIQFGCSQEPEGPPQIRMWQFGGVPGYREWVREAVRQFNTAPSEFQVDLEMKDWDTQRESLISSTIVGDGPDIIMIHHKYAVEFGELGGLLPLETFDDFDEISDLFFPNVLEQVEFEGKHYGVPVFMLPFVLAVNTHLFDRHGLEIPETWEEFLAIGPTLKENGIYALTMPGGPNLDTGYRFLALLYKAGGRVLNENWSEAVFNGPAGTAALEFLRLMMERGFFPEASAAYKFDENAALWTSGRAAISLEGPWWQDAVSDQYGFDLSKLALAPVPAPSEPPEGNSPGTLLDVVMVSITGYTKVRQEAWTVVKDLFVEHPAWQEADPVMGGLPTLKSAYAPGRESGYISLDVLAEESEVGIGWPGHPAITEIQRHVADAVNMVLSGEREPKEALADAADEVNELLSEY